MNQAKLHPNDAVSELRERIHATYDANEADVLHGLIERIKLSEDDRKKVAAVGANYVERVRKERSPSMMEAFLAEYGLSTTEGVGLMCLAEALLRVPDADTYPVWTPAKTANHPTHKCSGGQLLRHEARLIRFCEDTSYFYYEVG